MNGSYVFSLHDQGSASNLLGIVAADGKGNLQGIVDVNTTLGVATAQPFNGTYSLGADGRGSATITYTPAPAMTFTMTVRLMMVSDKLTYLYSNDSYLGMSKGVMEKQSTSTYSSADLSGSYAFLLKGFNPVANPQPPPENSAHVAAIGGVYTADGARNLNGMADTSAGGFVLAQTIAGTYSIANNGAGQASITMTANGQQTTSHFSLAMVSPSKFYLLTTDDVTLQSANAPLLAGVAELQSGPFSDASLTGSYVAYDQGEHWLQLLRFDAGGNGHMSNGFTHERDTSGTTSPLSSGPLSEPSGYSVESNGRVSVTVTAYNGTGFAYFYMVSPERFFVLVNDVYPATGEGFAQNALGFNWADLTERYAVNVNGFGYDGIGWMLPYYRNYPTSWMGWMDYGSNVKLEPTFSLNLTNTNGIGTATVSDYGASLSTMQCYVISNSKMLMMSTAPSLDANVLITLDKIVP